MRPSGRFLVGYTDTMRSSKEWRRGVAIGVLILIGCWLGLSIWGLGVKAEIAIRQARQAETDYRELEVRKATLQANLDRLGTTRGQDAAIRTAFGVAKPGEEVIVVVPPLGPTTTPPQGWLDRFLGWLGL